MIFDNFPMENVKLLKKGEENEKVIIHFNFFNDSYDVTNSSG